MDVIVLTILAGFLVSATLYMVKELGDVKREMLLVGFRQNTMATIMVQKWKNDPIVQGELELLEKLHRNCPEYTRILEKIERRRKNADQNKNTMDSGFC